MAMKHFGLSKSTSARGQPPLPTPERSDRSYCSRVGACTNVVQHSSTSRIQNASNICSADACNPALASPSLVRTICREQYVQCTETVNLLCKSFPAVRGPVSHRLEIASDASGSDSETECPRSCSTQHELNHREAQLGRLPVPAATAAATAADEAPKAASGQHVRQRRHAMRTAASTASVDRPEKQRHQQQSQSQQLAAVARSQPSKAAAVSNRSYSRAKALSAILTCCVVLVAFTTGSKMLSADVQKKLTAGLFNDAAAGAAGVAEAGANPSAAEAAGAAWLPPLPWGGTSRWLTGSFLAPSLWQSLHGTPATGPAAATAAGALSSNSRVAAPGFAHSTHRSSTSSSTRVQPSKPFSTFHPTPTAGSKPSVRTASSSTTTVSTEGTPTGASSTSSGGSKTGAAGSIKMYAVVDADANSPFKAHSPQEAAGPNWTADWGDVLKHMAQRLAWTDERFDLQVISQQQLKTDPAARDELSKALGSSSSQPIFFGISVTDPDVAYFLASATANLPTALFWDSDPQLISSSRVDGFAPSSSSPVAQLLAQYVGFSREARAARVMKTLDLLWSRNTSDDLLYIWLVLLNEYVTPVPLVANTTKGTDLPSLFCMIKNCGRQIKDCVTDKTCKGGLDCLEGCAFNDQVCQYRCIVSYETPQFEQFALCILQLHNCRGLDAQVPMQPDPAPMSAWRGQPLTHEMAEDLFIGWKSAGPQLPSEGTPLKPYSWLVAAGKNPAYDAFGCQHQLYSRGKGRGQMWYEPVFRVVTLEGQEVWRRRRYRVRRGDTPGTFHYSVLDNGVTSNEYWRIIDCAEDLTYCLFYYSGAAAAAGMSYTGAVLATADGLWPQAYTGRVHGALRQAGIEPWELSIVDNSRCAEAPL